METIRVRLLNYASMHIDCDLGTAQELNEFFSFFVPGYKFMPAFRNRLWDGRIRLFTIATQELPAGLFNHLLKFCEHREYELVVEDSKFYGKPDDHNSLNINDLYDYINSLDLPFEIRDYQFDAVATGLHRKRGILLSPTGSGKSLIIYVLIKYYLDLISSNKKILVIVPTTSLVEQMHNDFAQYGMNTENECHKIYSGKDKNTSKNVIISTWQSIYKLPRQWFQQFGMIIGDECHGFKSKSLMSIMNKACDAEYRFGTTGTLDGAQTHELVLQGLFGKIYRVTTTKSLQDNNTLAKLNIKRVELVYDEKFRKSFGKQTYQQEIDFIVTHKKRNQFIANLSVDLNGNTLVLFQFVEKHGKILFDIIDNKVAEGRKVFFVSGSTDTEDREAIRAIVEKQKDAIIVASLGTFSTGINIKNLHNIIFASPSKSQIRVLQSIGRGLRKSDDGRTTNLYDIIDNLSWKSRKNFAFLHSIERLKMYRRENFTFKTVKINIKNDS
ncbi:DEAD/DEAH box helicase family protein [bacterium]|jgi:superfamily II DNA or RNA helicase|nr:DEAD/DEAH box helicase family protein [bacterium]MDB4349982.1 DEAD/DEAH box helicase family protein [bacterium]